jgi:hypothetical protein
MKSKDPGMVIKLDTANAFNRVKHSFLLSVLKAYGFYDLFISWIKSCIGCPWISPLIYGHPSQFFRVSRGLRQGFPLSPFLYILLSDSLSHKLEEETKIDRLLGLLIARGVKEINHSQFADDTLLLGAATTIIAKRFQKVLDSFLSTYGGQMNSTNCKIYGWNVSGHIKEHISRILGFPVITTWTHFKYLGMLIFLTSYGKIVW